MGAYINLKLADPSVVVEVNDFMAEAPEGDELNKRSRLPVFEERPSTYYHAVGETQLKVSGHSVQKDCIDGDGGISTKQLWAGLFRRVHAEYDVLVLDSPPLDAEYGYLTDEQRAAITDDGEARVGEKLVLYQ
jgi:hypothetical protein